MNNDSQKSCQPCCCDEGANHLCQQHQEIALLRTTPRASASSYGGVVVGPSSSQSVSNDGLRTPWGLTSTGQPSLQPSWSLDPFSSASPLPLRGIGGAPIRASFLPKGPAERKQYPLASGVLDYFPDALAVIANVSWQGNEQHNPGKPLHWDRSKSGDEADTMIRHFLERGTRDTDGIRHSAKLAWRALALLQKELEQEGR